MDSVRLSNIIAPNFKRVHQAIKSGSHQKFWLIGGRGSLKSSTIAAETVLGVMKDPDANGIVFRKVGNTIRTSVKTTLEWAVDRLGVSHLWDSTVSPMELVYKPTGQQIILSGLDDPRKRKSIKLRNGYFKYSWFEELDEFDGMEEIRNVNQSIVRGGDRFVQFASFNPPRDPAHWVNQEILNQDPQRLIHRSSYLESPKEWLGEQFFKDAQYLQETNPLAYDHEYLGIATGLSESVIFNGKYSVMEFDPMPDWDGPYFGADWGFATDPSVLVKAYIENLTGGRKNLWVEYAKYGYKVDTMDLPALFDTVPRSRDYTIRADNARPETISHMRRCGFNCIGAEKWKGSVEDGIEILRGFDKIFIHPRNTEFQEEARLYSYKVDRYTKDILPDIIDAYNHGWDALRYALAPLIKQKGGGFIVI